jgi:fructose-1,6-bisphosphatase/inositol monophosphatase family enzyme
VITATTRRLDSFDRGTQIAVCAVLVEEAGGRVTDFAGKSLDITCGHRLRRNQGMLASNGALHTATLQAIRRAP